jgi:hypothetical protein
VASMGLKANVRVPYDEAFQAALRIAVPEHARRYLKELRMQDRGWLVHDEYLPVVSLLIAWFFARGTEFGDGARPREPVRYERPPEECERFQGWLTTPEIVAFIGSGGVVLHRPVSPQPDLPIDTEADEFWDSGYGIDIAPRFGEPGGLRWFDEVFQALPSGALIYKSDLDPRDNPGGPWTKRTTMRREQARLVGRIVNVTCNRLQELPRGDYRIASDDDEGAVMIARAAFAAIWDSVWNSGVAEQKWPWSMNAWVWRIEIERSLPR